MAKYTYPGVYVEEVPSGERSVGGVSTSITAFVGYTAKGRLNEPTRIQNFGEFERIFGGLHPQSEVSYAVRQYFLNGGTESLVVRTATGAGAASVTLKNGVDGAAESVMTISALSEGVWGNALRIQVDYATPNPDSYFNLIITEMPRGATAPANQETFRNLSMNPQSTAYAVNVINATSRLVKVELGAATVGASVVGESLSGFLPTGGVPLAAGERLLRVAMNGEGPHEVALFPAGAETRPSTLADIAAALQAGLAAASGKDEFQNAVVEVVGTNYLKIKSGVGGAASVVTVLPGATENAAAKLKLGLAAGGTETEAAARLRPAQTGTVTKELADLAALNLLATDATGVTVETETNVLVTKAVTLGSVPQSLPALADALQSRIRAAAGTDARLKGAAVKVAGKRLVLTASAEMGEAILSFSDTVADTLNSKLGLEQGGANVQWYSLGSTVTTAGQVAGVVGSDGEPPTATEILGSEGAKTGLYALENADMFNLLCIPRMADKSMGNGAGQIIAEAMAYCERRRAFLLVDPPETVGSRTGMEQWMAQVPRSKNAAVYFPHVMVADPMADYRLRALPPSGTMAGIFARTDATRGIWKAPAGVDTALMGVQGLTATMTDAENGLLNPLGINCLRNFPVYGKVSWGARTLVGADEMASEWKYVSVRRLALHIEESLYRGTKWAVFEPNDEPLWAQIRLSVGSFMHQLFRQGAFQGASPKQAYFVKCDAEVTTQADVNLGVVNIVVGFAPLKPAEFVVLKLQQLAGQSQ